MTFNLTVVKSAEKHVSIWKEEMGVSKNNGTQKWMVKIMENPIKTDDLGVPLFLETPRCFFSIDSLGINRHIVRE